MGRPLLVLARVTSRVDDVSGDGDLIVSSAVPPVGTASAGAARPRNAADTVAAAVVDRGGLTRFNLQVKRFISAGRG